MKKLSILHQSWKPDSIDFSVVWDMTWKTFNSLQNYQFYFRENFKTQSRFSKISIYQSANQLHFCSSNRLSKKAHVHKICIARFNVTSVFRNICVIIIACRFFSRTNGALSSNVHILDCKATLKYKWHGIMYDRQRVDKSKENWGEIVFCFLENGYSAYQRKSIEGKRKYLKVNDIKEMFIENHDIT